MCKIRYTYFSIHNIVERVATAPFTLPGGPDEFLSDRSEVTSCKCERLWVAESDPLAQQQLNVDELARMLQVRDRVRNLLAGVPYGSSFRPSMSNPCAAILTAARELCPFGTPGYEEHCENKVEVREYRPLSMLLADLRVDVEWGDVDDQEAWERDNWLSVPVFPVADMFYSESGFAGAPPALEIDAHRDGVRTHGVRMHMEKLKLQEWNCKADKALAVLERKCGGANGGKAWKGSSLLLKVARSCARKAAAQENVVAEQYWSTMQFANWALAELGKIPPLGESVATADGRYTLSRDQLDLAHLNTHAVLAACDGAAETVGGVLGAAAEH